MLIVLFIIFLLMIFIGFIIWRRTMIDSKIKHWFQRITRGWSDDETWNLNYDFIKWINSRFKKYKEKASEIVDLEFHKFNYKNKVYSQLELINEIIELSDKIINEEECFDEDIESCIESHKRQDKIINEIFEIFKIIYWNMWW